MSKTYNSRREFLREIALTGSVAFLAASPWIDVFADSNSKGLSNQLNLAFIGTGSRGMQLLNTIFPVTKQCNVKISAICDNYTPHLEMANQLCIKAGHKPNIYTDFRDLLKKEKPDGVIIATPLTQHAHIAIECMNRGIHTFCEKAMAKNLDDIKDMYDTHISTGQILQIGHQRLFNPIYLDGMKRILDGDIGPIVQMRAYWHRNNDWRRPLPNNDISLEKQINWRLYKERSAGLLTELMSHQIHVANWAIQQEPVSVTGTGSIVYWNDGRTIPDNVALIYTYENGVQFIYDSLTSNKKHGLEEQIMGKKGTIEFETNRYYTETPQPAPGIQQLVNDIEKGIFNKIPIGGTSWIPEVAAKYEGEHIAPKDFYEDTQFELEAFANFIRKGEAPESITKGAYYASVWTLLGEMAIDSGQKITIPEKYKI